MTLFFYNYFNSLIMINLFLLCSITIIMLLSYNYYFSSNNDILLNKYSIYKSIKFINFLLILVTFIIFIISFINYFFVINNYINNKNLFFNSQYLNLYYDFNIDFFGYVILFLAYFVGILSFLALDNRLYFKNLKYLLYLNYFIILVYFYVTTNNVLLFFFFYELLLLPSFLIVYNISPSRRAVQASLYFIIWTQVGSFIVLCVISYLIIVTKKFTFYEIRQFNFTPQESFYIFFFLFLGFGFKVPIWPFHYWLTKTHVEAPAGFSMYLSGFLVKTAIYGYYKFTSNISCEISTVLLSTIAIIGIIDASLKMWGQTDLKKLVAYGTVQEMNIIYLVFSWGDSLAVVSGMLFCIMHGLLSALMFYIVDCIQRRYMSRLVVEVSGILQVTPNLAIMIILMCVLFSGLPGTLKFSCEFFIFSGLIEASAFSTFFILIVANVLGLIGFSKSWFDVVFGMNVKNFKYIPLDLTIKESFIIILCILNLIIISYFNFII